AGTAARDLPADVRPHTRRDISAVYPRYPRIYRTDVSVRCIESISTVGHRSAADNRFGRTRPAREAAHVADRAGVRSAAEARLRSGAVRGVDHDYCDRAGSVVP